MKLRIIFRFLVLFLFLVKNLYAGLESDYYDFSLEELSSYPIYSVDQNKIAAKREEESFKTASAIHIITNEDIIRSGATSIAEALRLAPGVQVSRLDSSRHLISIRGFSESFTNKLLILLDGRSVYTPLFAGVYADEIDYPLEDIDRIEVVRGPGASIWGSNAVNGVINIITKDASQTQGNSVNVTIGNQDRLITSLRSGKKINQDSYFRSYAKFVERNSTKEAVSRNDAADDWNRVQIGFRLDNDVQNASSFQGNFYKINKNAIHQLPELSPNLVNFVKDKEEISGVNFLAKWQRELNLDSLLELQLYANYIRRDHITLDQDIYSFDFDFSYSVNFEKHKLIWGGGVRNISYDLEGTEYISFSNPRSSNSLANIFIQDKFALIADKLYLTLGTKFEYNEYTHLEHQPTARLAWNISDRQNLWGAISKAVRIPSKVEDDFLYALESNGSKYYRWSGNKNFQSEELLAHEIGYRIKASDSLSFDSTLFYNKYKHLRTLEKGVSVSDSYRTDYGFNYGVGDVYGGEISIDLQLNQDWQIMASYSHLKMMLNTPSFSTDIFLEDDEGQSPKHIYNIRSHLNLTKQLELDNIIYYSDELPKVSGGIRSYIRFDSRLGYVTKDGTFKFSLVGQNLFDNSHEEAAGSIPSNLASSIGRSLYINMLMRY